MISCTVAVSTLPDGFCNVSCNSNDSPGRTNEVPTKFDEAIWYSGSCGSGIYWRIDCKSTKPFPYALSSPLLPKSIAESIKAFLICSTVAFYCTDG